MQPQEEVTDLVSHYVSQQLRQGDVPAIVQVFLSAELTYAVVKNIGLAACAALAEKRRAESVVA